MIRNDLYVYIRNYIRHIAFLDTQKYLSFYNGYCINNKFRISTNNNENEFL